MAGKVYLTGAGPGDPELLTVKALKALQTADVIVYDRLVSDEIMALVPEHVEKIFAGKSCKQKAMTQDEINSLLIKLAGEGKQVVRLKGGDPMLFGRGGEEIIVLRQEGIAFEVIPGITSAQGCGAIANIPLTHRGLATGVRFFTGHRQSSFTRRGEDGRGALLAQASQASPHPNPPPQAGEGIIEPDWQSLADPETTLVVYMGLANLALICEKLIAYGLPADFPAAAIENGTTPKEKIVISTLDNLATDVTNAGLEPPTLVIIGKVVELSRKIRKL